MFGSILVAGSLELARDPSETRIGVIRIKPLQHPAERYQRADNDQKP